MREAMPGARIRALRERHGLSQIDFARLLGVSNVTVNRWEHDRVAPQPAMLGRLLAAERDGLLPQPLPTPPGNLPLLSGATIGRSVEIANLVRAVHQSPLVTITGAGGLGKTRLAIEAVHHLAGEFARVWFIDLAAVASADAVNHTVARVIGLRESSSEAAAGAIAAIVQNRPNVLVLDNCEHVRDAAAAIAAAITVHGGPARVLATSRLALRTPGEHRFVLDPLQPDDAVALFFARAGRPIAHDDRTRAVITGICQRLDHLPLAIELAASRTAMLSVTQIADRLDRGFELLRGGTLAPGRWQAIEAMIAWSYDLLDAETARFFRTLGVFAGGFDLAAVEAITQHPAAIDLLTELANHSLIVVEWPADRAAARYRLLESLSAYARRQLVDTGEIDAAARRHASYFADLTETLAPGLLTAAYKSSRAQLDLEHENIVAALTWSTADSDRDIRFRIVSAMLRYWIRASLFTEGREWTERSLADGWDDSPRIRARLLFCASSISIYLADYNAASAALAHLIELANQLDDPEILASAGDVDGLLSYRRNELGRARRALESAHTRYSELGDHENRSRVLLNLGAVTSAETRYDEARRYLIQAINAARITGNLDTEGMAVANLAHVSVRTGEYSQGLEFNARAVTVLETLDYTDVLAYTQISGAQLHLLLGDYQAALETVTPAVERNRLTGNTLQLGDAEMVWGLALAGVGRLLEALHAFRDVADREYRFGNIRNVLYCLDSIARLQADAGDPLLSARLQGGAERLRQTQEASIYEPFDYAGTVQSARSKLGEAAYASAFQQGRELSTEALLAEALNLGVLRGNAPSFLVKRPVSPASARVPLTERQLDVLRLVAAGLSNRDIGDELAISTRTVERHLSMIFNELGVDRRSAAIAVAAERGLL